jgi:hypothetical protein
MKTRIYENLSSFFTDIKDYHNNPDFPRHEHQNNRSFCGLPLSEINQYKFSYPFGVEKLRQMEDVKFEKEVKVRYFDSFDGYDININRMLDGLDFLVNTRKVRKLPKAIDIVVNVAENAYVNYEAMLHKTYAALKITDQLETAGVRVAVWVAFSSENSGRNTEKGRWEDAYVEVCVKQYADPVNLGALCTTISPWFMRHWILLWLTSRWPITASGMGQAAAIPPDMKRPGTITIESGNCLSQNSANVFINQLKIAS